MKGVRVMRGSAESAKVLFDDYNRYMFKTRRVQKQRAQGFRNPYKWNAERMQLFADLDLWCAERGISSRLWVYGLFALRAWLFGPPLDKRHLCSEKLIPKFQRISERALDGYRSQVNPVAAAPDPNVEIVEAIEKRKALFLRDGRASDCMRDLPSTYCYHPRSQHCKTCPVQMECRAELRLYITDFDILALREGKITVEEVRAALGRSL
jgi:hypothetical protein